MSGPQAAVNGVPSVYGGAPAHGNVSHLLLPQACKRLVAAWLEEDTPSFDYGGFVVGDAMAEARLLGKSEGVLAGVPFFDEVFRQLECTVQWHLPEGAALTPIHHVATVRGPIRNLLLGERVALNTLARCSGIATKTSRLTALVARHAASSGLQHAPSLAATRKTTPGFRLPEKYSVLVGGADPHRHDLSAMTMLKDNHVWACGGDIARAVAAAKAAGGFAVKVEVECRDEGEARAAVRAGADVVMLDNFAPGEVEPAVARLRDEFGQGRFLVEVSGGLTEANLAGFVARGVDVISSSALHQGVQHVDFSLKVVPKDKTKPAEGARETGGEAV